MAILGRLGRATRRRPVAAAMAGVALLYLAAVNARWDPTPDSALYLGIGRNLARGQGYSFLDRPQTRTEPLVPLLAAANYRLLGDRYLALNLLYSAMGLAAAAMVFLLARQASGIGHPAVRVQNPESGERIGSGLRLNAAVTVQHPSSSIQHPASGVPPWAFPLVCCLAVALSWRLYYESTRILTDVPFTLLGLCGFWAASRIAPGAGGVSAGTNRRGGAIGWSLAAWGLLLAATLTRLIGVAFLAALALALLLPGGRVGRAALGWRRRAVALVPAVLAAAGLTGWIALATRQPGPLSPGFYRLREVLAHFEQHVLPRMGPAVAELPAAALEIFWGQHLPAAGLIVAAVCLAGMARLAWRRQWLLLTPVWCYLPLLVLVGPEAARARYLLPLLGWLAVWFFTGLLTLGAPAARTWDRRAGQRPGRGAGILLGTGLAVLVLPAVPRIARQAFYFAHHPDYYRVVDRGKWSGYVASADWLRTRTDPDVRVFTDEPRVVQLLSGRSCSDRPGRVPQQAVVRPVRWADYAVEDGCDLVLIVGGQSGSAEGFRTLAADPRFERIHGQAGPDDDLGGRSWRGRFLVFQRVNRR